MPRERLPQEYESPLDLETLATEARSGEMPVGRALAMLHRSPYLTQEMINQVCSDARSGYEWDAIAARVGVGKRTLRNWLRRGEERRNAIDDWADRRRELPIDATEQEILDAIGEPPVEDDLLIFFDSVARAFANGECSLVDVIRDDAIENGNVASAKWLLTARFPSWRQPGKGGQRYLDEVQDTSDVDVIAAIEAKLKQAEERQKALASGSA